jgi:excinuclease ABC subunit C
MIIKYIKKIKLPDSPGVYIFKDKKGILYIGKATSLRSRVQSYFGRDLIATRGPLLVDMVTKAENLEFIQTDSVLEALILEANLIKKHQPKYNTKEKDNKSFNYVCITKDKLEKVLVTRGRLISGKQYPNSSRLTLSTGGSDTTRNLHIVSQKYLRVFGPFPNGLQLRTALKIVRKIFPYYDDSSSKKQNIQFYKQLGLVPEENYKNNLKNLILFFEGKKGKIVSNLKKEMNTYAKKMQFERANEIKKQIFALEHINDVALIKEDTGFSRNEQNWSRVGAPGERVKRDNFDYSAKSFRVEAYDVAHMSGQNMVGVMTVIQDGEPEKSEYKKFIIRTQKNSNDTGALEEILSRRFRHTEWGLPNLVVVDGSTAQVNVVKQVLNRYQFDIPIVGVVKDDRHKPKAILGNEQIIKKYKKSILLANSEAHRFAITFHKHKRSKEFLK